MPCATRPRLLRAGPPGRRGRSPDGGARARSARGGRRERDAHGLPGRHAASRCRSRGGARRSPASARTTSTTFSPFSSFGRLIPPRGRPWSTTITIVVGFGFAGVVSAGVVAVGTGRPPESSRSSSPSSCGGGRIGRVCRRRRLRSPRARARSRRRQSEESSSSSLLGLSRAMARGVWAQDARSGGGDRPVARGRSACRGRDDGRDGSGSHASPSRAVRAPRTPTSAPATRRATRTQSSATGSCSTSPTSEGGRRQERTAAHRCGRAARRAPGRRSRRADERERPQREPAEAPLLHREPDEADRREDARRPAARARDSRGRRRRCVPVSA